MENTLVLKEVLTPETYAKVVREIQRTALYADNRLPLSYVQGMVSKWEAEAYDKSNLKKMTNKQLLVLVEKLLKASKDLKEELLERNIGE